MAVEFPADAIKDDGADVLGPLQTLLRGVNVLPNASDTDNEALWSVTGTPTSVAILESGATALSKGWTILIGALGGTAAVGAGVTNFWTTQSSDVQIVLGGGTALVLVAAIVAIAIMVTSDVKSRAKGAVMVYQARQEIALKFLDQSLAVAQAKKVADAVPSDPVTLDATVIGLAITGHRALVENASAGGVQGHLAGFKHNGTDMLVGWKPIGSDNVEWVPPSQLRIVQYTFPAS